MFQYLLWTPAITSLVLGVVYLVLGEARPSRKIGGAGVFLMALFLQFASAYPLAGLGLQTVLALTLAIWWRVDAARAGAA